MDQMNLPYGDRIQQIIDAFNGLNGAQIRWSDELQELTTTNGDRYQPGIIEDAVKHILPPE